MRKIKKHTKGKMPGDIFHVGEYIKDELEARGFSQQDLADKMKVSKSEISHLITGRRGVNAQTAVLLENALGIDAEFWMNLQIRYDIDLVKKKASNSIKIAKISSAKKQKLRRFVKLAS